MDYQQDELRFYSFVPALYLNALQRGLQTAHAVSEMMVTEQSEAAAKLFQEWAKNHKTIIILNALNHGTVTRTAAALTELAKFFDLPTALFREDEESMNGMATAFGIVLPSRIFNTKLIQETMPGEPIAQPNSEWDYMEFRTAQNKLTELLLITKQFHLAQT